MKILPLLLFAVAFALSGCVSSSPAVSKGDVGNVNITVAGPKNVDLEQARIWIDEKFVGNQSRDYPVLYLKRGLRHIRVECPGMETYAEDIFVLGDPNRQFIKVTLNKKE